MSPSTVEQLAALRVLVEQAKALPMSASCMINRGEALRALDAALASARSDEARLGDSDAARTLVGARADADRVLAEARERAEALVAADAVHAEAVARASALDAEARSESEALRREADAYVDRRMAELEASLSKTLSQLKTMRERLAERSHLDDAPLG